MTIAPVSVSLSALMDELLLNAPVFRVPELGSLVEGEVIDIFGNKILLDIGGVCTGLITGKEARDKSNTLQSLKAGDRISAYVIGGENEEGYFLLSLRKASQERTWRNFLRAYEEKEIISVRITEANKGGLLVLVDGIKGFIPVSQLAPLHYPRVDGANSGEILMRLQKLVGMDLSVKIITVDQEGGKLILSEKAAVEDERQESLRQLTVGGIVKGKISGIVKFGIFVAFSGLEGLVHISEIEWGHVKDPTNYGKIGDPVEVMIIGIEGEKISLSMKRLTKDPWEEAAKKYSVGSLVTGTVDRITQFGVFLKLDDDLSGLIHLSEISDQETGTIPPEKAIKIGQKINAKVIALDLEDHRIGLSIKALEETAVKNTEEVSESVKEEKKKEPSKKTSKTPTTGAKKKAQDSGPRGDSLLLGTAVVTTKKATKKAAPKKK